MNYPEYRTTWPVNARLDPRWEELPSETRAIIENVVAHKQIPESRNNGFRNWFVRQLAPKRRKPMTTKKLVADLKDLLHTKIPDLPTKPPGARLTEDEIRQLLNRICLLGHNTAVTGVLMLLE